MQSAIEPRRCGGDAIEVIATPGHPPACVTYRIEVARFTGDALFTEGYGTGRCDVPPCDRRRDTAA